ncbi:LOW QUALITY PROTEIN: rab11 family-interacting protein 1 [Phycodurus eques]|uniref:LOW QUALITY PROTEIN: rab11 family-interacting protein 1 n=1 Tax=Phycodurus eques TaxID=693459 RepID=UPI002ACF02F3|nr:LOW QUALITY PROTEIN: rab11 family-interacting protein 1 [Phycodurus eques]
MSLVEQSQQSFPTSVQVTVHQARNLRPKGKNGTNDAYAIIQVAKDKFSTSVAEKSTAPMWKEEASFGLPLFHQGNVDRCTLYVVVMHRVQAGLDKFLGQAVVNLVELHENKARQRPDWFPLVDKSGKADKLRGDVLLGITFMRNNMSASMVDLSMHDKPRSRISKFKDKVRLKKKDSFSDSGSAMSQVLTDSEGDHDSLSPNQTAKEKKKNKLKNLFAPKSNLQRNTSQSMSTLGSPPRKNSSLSGSRSSGINVETPEVKKKFKFPGHKRSGSSDSKMSLGPLSLLGRSKHSNSDINDPSVNSRHVNADATDARSGSTLSLNSSGQGSMENVQQHATSVLPDRHTPGPLFRSETRDRLVMEQQRRQEEEERRQIEATRLQEEENRRQSDEYERNRRFLEDEARREKQWEEEEEEHRRLEATEDEERRKLEEVTQKNEAQKSQEEASMSERLSSLFGIIRRKEEKKEEALQHPEEVTTQASHYDVRDQQVLSATNSFENVSLSSSAQFNSGESPAGEQKSSLNPQTSSAMLFLNRTARVSTVKPRLSHSLESESSEHLQSEYSEPQTSSAPVDQQWSSPGASESTLSSVPYDSPDTFSYLHSSLAPLRLRETPPGSPLKSLPDSPCESPPGSPSNSIDVSSSPTIADKMARAPLPPLYPIYEAHTGGTQELQSSRHTNGSQQDKKLSLPLPDYETLFPQKRHGVQGTTRWDHIIAEVNQRRMDITPELTGPEMSVDGPEDLGETRPSFSEESPDVGYFQTHQQENRRRSSKQVAAPPPPKQVSTMHSQSMSDSGQRESQNFGWIDESLTRSLPSVTAGMLNMDKTTSESLQEISLDESKNALQQSFLPARGTISTSQMDWDSGTPAEQTKHPETSDIHVPTARPRQKSVIKEPTEQEYFGATPAFADLHMSGNIQKTPSFSMSEMDKNGKQGTESDSEFQPYPSTDLLSRYMEVPEKPPRTSEDLYSRVLQTEQKPENSGMTGDDLDQIFNEEKPVDPFSSLNGYETSKMEDEFRQISPVFQRQNSSRRLSSPPSRSNSQKALEFHQESSDEEKTTRTQRHDVIESITQRHPADGKAQVHHFKGEDPFGSDPFATSEPLPVLMEEPSSKAEAVSVRKKPKRALLPPSVSQFVSPQISNGDVLSSTLSRPHPVKPVMHSIESQHHTSTSALKDMHVQNGTAGKVKVPGMADSGPFTQLTHEELITLVVRQQADLSKKDCKIGELEAYIDNLLVRVIEEKPAILQAMSTTEPV